MVDCGWSLEALDQAVEWPRYVGRQPGQFLVRWRVDVRQTFGYDQVSLNLAKGAVRDREMMRKLFPTISSLTFSDVRRN